jgi:hypothetical protein
MGTRQLRESPAREDPQQEFSCDLQRHRGLVGIPESGYGWDLVTRFCIMKCRMSVQKALDNSSQNLKTYNKDLAISNTPQNKNIFHIARLQAKKRG